MIDINFEEMRNKILDFSNYEPDPEYQKRLEEYHNKIENDFQAEWHKKKFKWFFKKRRQQKLRRQIFYRYAGPVFWIIEETLDDLLPKAWENSEYFNKFVDVKDLALGDKNYFSEENLIDKINSFGCTSFNLNSEQLAEMIDDDKQQPHFPKCPQCGQYLKLIAGNPAETYWICESCGKKYILNLFTEKLNEFKEESTND